MGRIIKLAVAVLVVYAAWQGASAQWNHFAFQDAVRQLIEFGADPGDDAIRTAVVTEGAKLGIRVDPERVTITRSADHVYIDASYTRPVQLLPRYFYNWPFTLKVERWFVPGGRIR